MDWTDRALSPVHAGRLPCAALFTTCLTVLRFSSTDGEAFSDLYSSQEASKHESGMRVQGAGISPGICDNTTMPSPFDQDQVLQRDIAWLKRRHRQLSRFRGPGEKRESLEAAYLQRLQSSQARVAQRQAGLPGLARPPELPISAHADAIVEAIRTHPVVIVAGETGSGKSTQLPKLCLEAGRGLRGLIGCTQPRRIAARSVARRVAEELNTELGHAVGFQVRFNDKVSADSYIKFMTDGILLAEVHGDRRLDAYDTLIIDEAHERSLNIDFLLGYLKQLRRKRPDLKIIITSATIDTERFSNHFDQAPV